MTNSLYLDIAKQGKNTWKSYLIVIPLASFFTFVVISTFTGMSLSALNSTTSEYPIQTKSILTIMLPKLIAIGIFFGVLFQHFHQRKIFTVINLEGFIRWKRILFSLALWLILQPPIFIASFLLDSSRYSLTFELQQWLSITPFAILITLFLHSCFISIVIGYIFQGLSLLISKPQYLIPFLGIIFGLIRTNSSFFPWSQHFSLSFNSIYCYLSLFFHFFPAVTKKPRAISGTSRGGNL